MGDVAPFTIHLSMSMAGMPFVANDAGRWPSTAMATDLDVLARGSRELVAVTAVLLIDKLPWSMRSFGGWQGAICEERCCGRFWAGKVARTATMNSSKAMSASHHSRSARVSLGSGKGSCP